MSLFLRFPRLWLVVAALALLGTGQAAAPPNAYDTLGRALTPFLQLFTEHSSTGHRALSLTLRVEEGSGATAEAAGAGGELLVEYPDRLRLRTPFFGEEITLCRCGDQVWVSPGAKLQALLARPEVQRRLPAPDRKYRLRPFTLPVPEQQLVFLPALFQVRAGSLERVAGVECQVLDLQLMPLLAKSLALRGWSGQVWIEPGGLPARLRLQGPQTGLTVRFEKVAFAPTLPPSAWVPEPNSDVALVPPVRYDQLLRALLGAH